jgi:flavin-dependent dehydrogenase
VIDVAIVGGGPAGSAAAIACAQAGLATTLFERRREATVARWPDGAEPEESIAPDTVALLQTLGVDCTGASAPYGGIATGSHVTLFLREAGLPGRHVRRSWLDGGLRAMAARSGVSCRLGVEVADIEREDTGGFLLRTSDGSMPARQVIDASGRRSWLAFQLGLSRRRMSPPLIAWRDVVAGPAQPGSIARFVPSPNGWTFLAPVSAGRIVRTGLRAARDKGDSAGPAPSRGATAHVATWRVVRHLAGPGWLIAGDAGAALDPAAGMGISFALKSGLAAGLAAAANAENSGSAPVLAARYDDAVLSEFEMAAGLLAQRYRELGICVLDKKPRQLVPA